MKKNVGYYISFLNNVSVFPIKATLISFTIHGTQMKLCTAFCLATASIYWQLYIHIKPKVKKYPTLNQLT